MMTTVFHHRRSRLALMAGAALGVLAATSSANAQGFMIKVDGETIAGDPSLSMPRVNITPPRTLGEAVPTRPRGRLDVEQISADELLQRLNIQLRFDGLDADPQLNVLPVNDRSAYEAGEYVGFVSTSNYSSWVERAEVRVFADPERDGERPELIDTVPVTLNAEAPADWQMPKSGAKNYHYVLRVYDAKGRFDETEPLPLRRYGRTEPQVVTLDDAARTAPGRGQNRLSIRNIPISGGIVTVNGADVPPGYSIRVLGSDVPVDVDNRFVVQKILPSGDHDVVIEVLGALKAPALTIERPINIPKNDFFYVGIADLTVGTRNGGLIEAASEGEFENVYTKGRLAFYLKGKVRGRYLITASADTGERPIDELFRDFDGKGPRDIIDRIDPDQFYPVYGDDSTIEEDAPTSGKFYVRIDRGDSYVMWGDFRAKIAGTDYVRTERALYGANAVYRSEATTSFGERKYEARLYAAQPDTLPQRDVLRGTGGSVYFLKRQDVHVASETLTIQYRDQLTNRIIDSVTLERGEDYEIDYTQGVVILSKPLNSTANVGGTVRDSSTGDANVNLVAQYEYTPTAGDVDGYNVGGRGQAWIGDKVRIGATGLLEQTGNGAGDADHSVIGADIMFRHSEGTWLRAEVAQSRGPGISYSLSDDGGLTNVDQASSGVANQDALAWKVEGQLDLEDITDGDIAGRITAHFESREAGFSSLDYDVAVSEQLWGLSAEVQVSEDLELSALYDEYRNDDGARRLKLEADAAYQLNEYWKATFGVAYSDLTDLMDPDNNGARTDAVVEIEYAPNDDDRYYVFAQGTLATTGTRGENHRVGVGAEVALTEELSAAGEVSYGSTGWAGQGLLVWEPDDDGRHYLGYERAADGNNNDPSLSKNYGGVVVGSDRKLFENWKLRSQANYDLFSDRRDLTSMYGVTYTPDEHWTFDTGFEFGRVEGTVDEDIDRRAISAGFAYVKDDDISARVRGEFRFDDADDDARDLTAYLVSAGVNWRADDNWRLLADLDAAFASGKNDDLKSGDYVEGSIGFAYRPVKNDTLNALFRYTYLYDLPGTDQVNANGETDGPRQRSHVLSADAIWQANDWLSLGAKYGFRIGEVESVRDSGDFNQSSAHLAIVRADVHILHNWDALLEGRVLWSPSAQTTDYGALAAAYRHVGKNVKVGVGYNFGRFSDDLTDLTHDDEGLFFNVVGKF